MANILRNKGLDQSKPQEASLDKADFGAKVASAAIEGRKQEKAPKQKKPDQQQHKDKTIVEQREDETRQIIGLSGGSITGAQVKTNQQLNNQTRTDVVDAWDDPTRIDDKKDDLDSALEKLQKRAELTAQITSVQGDDVIINLDTIGTLNDVTQSIRNFSNFAVMESDPSLYLVLGGLSESFDDYLASKGVLVQDPTSLTGKELEQVFALLNKKRNILNEEEKEAELILAGAVAMLALEQILEKLEELGLDPELAASLEGKLAQLLNEAKEDGSELNAMYLRIKEETEFSKLAAEEMDAAA